MTPITVPGQDSVREDLLRGVLRIGVFGEFSAGKSTFLNALLGEELLTVATEPTTALPTEVVFGGAFNVRVLAKDGPEIARLYANGEIPFWTRLAGRGLLDKLKMEGEAIRTFVRTWSAEGGRASEGALLRIEWPQAFLRQKLVLVDTPGTNVGIDRHGEMTQRVASQVDIAICVVDARHGLKGTSLKFIQEIALRVGQVFVVLNKLDCVDADEREELKQELMATLIAQWPSTSSALAGVHGCSSLLPFDETIASRSPELAEAIPRLKESILQALRDNRGNLILRRNGNPVDRLVKIAKDAEANGDLHAEHDALREAIELSHEAEIPLNEELLQRMEACEAKLHRTVHEEAKAQDLLAEAVSMVQSGKSTPNTLLGIIEKAAAAFQRTNHRAEAVVEAFAQALDAHRELRTQLLDPIRSVLPKAWLDSFEGDLEGLLDAPTFVWDHALARKAEIGCALEIPAAWALHGMMIIFAADQGPEVGHSQSDKAAKEGFRWVQKAGASGDPLSMWILGRLHALPDGPARHDLKEAMDWYYRAAEKGLLRAQWEMGECFHLGLGTAVNAQEALRWFRRAAESGDAASQNRLALFFDQDGPLANRKEALFWCRKSAEQGFIPAMANLGAWMLQGNADDIREGVAWIQKAADQEYAVAQNLLGLCFRDGLGLEENPSQAVTWFMKAADAGLPAAQSNLANCYQKGYGVEKDIQESLKLYRLAAENGDDESPLTLGLALVDGDGCPQDIHQGVQWVRTAAERGNSLAMWILGTWNLKGIHLGENPVMAVSWFQQGAELGDPECQLSLAECMDEGVGCLKNRQKAMEWLKKSVDQGFAEAQTRLGWCYKAGDGITANDFEAARLFKLAAEQGNAEAQNSLALCLERGEGIKQDSSEAVTWYRKAAEQDYANAQLNLACSYRDGTGVPQDFREAAFWFRKAAEQGNADAQAVLGDFYQEGHGVPKASPEAVNWYRKAAEQGHPAAQADLGICYLNGTGVQENPSEAAKWFKEAARQDSLVGQFFLGVLLRDGRGVRQDASEAARWFKRAAEAGLSDAQECLAWLYWNGNGVSQSYNQAFSWFQKAAEQGEIESCAMLGICYDQGHGVSKNASKAVEWYSKAAEMGHSNAQLWLGLCFRTGQGVAQNHSKAVVWFRKALEGGNAEAGTYLGICYANGEGVSQDIEMAKRYLREAAEQGDSDAIGILNQIKENESSCFITTASSRVLGWADQGPELSLFRAFRDEVLKCSELGRSEVELYYDIAPRIVAVVESSPLADAVWMDIAERHLRPILHHLEHGEGAVAHACYRAMVLELADCYLSADPTNGLARGLIHDCS